MLAAKVTPEEKEWHETRARQAGITISDYLRELLCEKRRSVELAPVEPESDKPLTLKEQYLQEIAETGAPLSAQSRLGITPSKLREWGKRPEFLKEVALAKARYLEGLEQEMADIGRGRKKGDTQAIGWLLNAHHPSHGRAKKELILSMLNPLVKRLVEFIQVEFGADANEKMKKALAAFQIEVRKKMSVMS